jgi:RNA polymerase sigma factor for flagellar operon FliA
MSASYENAPSTDVVELEKLVTEHAELVRRIAYHLLARMPSHIDVDDMIQAGMIGLLSAAENFSAAKGANFATYAGIRIRGAMLDEARKMSHTPRSTFRNARQISVAIQDIERETGRDARDTEIAAKLNVDMDELHRMLESAASTRMLSLDELAGETGEVPQLSAEDEGGPLEALEQEQFQRDMVAAIEKLPQREQLVLSLYYEQELNLREIGEILGVGESRVCQIHAQAVLRVRARLGAWLDNDF